jgi:hypothetical protein
LKGAELIMVMETQKSFSTQRDWKGDDGVGKLKAVLARASQHV